MLKYKRLYVKSNGVNFLLQSEEAENSTKTTKNLFGIFAARPTQVENPHCTCSEYETDALYKYRLLAYIL
jgi:hypothetical protein